MLTNSKNKTILSLLLHDCDATVKLIKCQDSRWKDANDSFNSVTMKRWKATISLRIIYWLK